MSAVVKLANVHKSFGPLKVLDGVSFEVGRGEVVALIGQSGSGKSTALRCINALETIEEGAIEVCGHAIHSLPSTSGPCASPSASSSRATTSSRISPRSRTSCWRRPA